MVTEIFGDTLAKQSSFAPLLDDPILHSNINHRKGHNVKLFFSRMLWGKKKLMFHIEHQCLMVK